MELKLILLALAFLLATDISTAYIIDSYNAQYNIVNNKVYVQTNIVASEAAAVSLPIPEDAKIELYLNDIKTNATIKDNNLILNLSKNDKIRFGYITEELIDKSNFLLNFPINYDTRFLKIILVLPEGAVLKKPITDTTGSIYPKPDSATTDGKSLIFSWKRNDLKAGEEIAIFTMYTTRSNYLYFVILIIIVFFIVLLYTLRKKQLRPKEKVRVIEAKEEKTEPEIIEHLKEDEQQIVRILKQREGQCEQGTLRVITSFSKAHLSRLLMELEARKIIYKEKRGKKNLIFLK